MIMKEWKVNAVFYNVEMRDKDFENKSKQICSKLTSLKFTIWWTKINMLLYKLSPHNFFNDLELIISHWALMAV